MTISVEFVVEAPERKQPEVTEDHKHIYQPRHLADHQRAQGQYAQRADDKRNPDEFAEIAFEQRTHADVVVERVDLAQVVAILRLPAFEPLRVNVKRQAVEILIRRKGHLP